jgi:hypothetical protein
MNDESNVPEAPAGRPVKGKQGAREGVQGVQGNWVTMARRVPWTTLF